MNTHDKPVFPDAGFALRLWAMLVDLSMVSLLIPVFSALSNRLSLNVVEYFGREALLGDGITQDLVIGCLIALGIALAAAMAGWFFGTAAFLACCESFFGATPGKWLLGIRVVYARSGASPGLLRAIARQSAKFFSWFSAGLGFLMSLWTRRKQALHDKIARCFVVRRERIGPRRIAAAMVVSSVLFYIQYPALERSALRLKSRVETIRNSYRAVGPVADVAWAIVRRGMEELSAEKERSPF